MARFKQWSRRAAKSKVTMSPVMEAVQPHAACGSWPEVLGGQMPSGRRIPGLPLDPDDPTAAFGKLLPQERRRAT